MIELNQKHANQIVSNLLPLVESEVEHCVTTSKTLDRFRNDAAMLWDELFYALTKKEDEKIITYLIGSVLLHTKCLFNEAHIAQAGKIPPELQKEIAEAFGIIFEDEPRHPNSDIELAQILYELAIRLISLDH